MKRINKKEKRLILIGVCAAVLILLVILAAWGIRQLITPKADTEQGLAYIRAAESEDIEMIEQKISQLERQDGGEDSRSFKEKFASSIVMGDSIAEGFSEYDVLNASSVVSKIGVHLYELEEQVQQAKNLNPQVIFLALGMNDVIATAGIPGSSWSSMKRSSRSSGRRRRMRISMSILFSRCGTALSRRSLSWRRSQSTMQC